MPLTLVLGPAKLRQGGGGARRYALAARRDALLSCRRPPTSRTTSVELAAPGVTLGRTLTFPRLIEEIALRARHRRARLTPLQSEQVMRRAIASLRLGRSPLRRRGRFRAGRRALDRRARAAAGHPRTLQLGATSVGGAAAERDAYARELAAIYRRYQEELAGLDRADAEAFAWGALDALRERPARWGATRVFFYGFDDSHSGGARHDRDAGAPG